jgi:hypothetical protein
MANPTPIKVNPECIKRATFWSPFEQYRDRIGQSFSITGPALIENPGTEDEFELYPIQFADGHNTHAWPEEIFEHES